MKERPILFSAPMVRAILAGTKTQTRRVVRDCWGVSDGVPYTAAPAGLACTGKAEIRCPHGTTGTKLWVRETFFAFGRWETRFSEKKGRDEWHFVDMTLESGHAYSYAADGGQPVPMRGKRDAGVTPGWWKRPAIFMPRAASRITLEITEVRVERLQAISEEDLAAEGIQELIDAGVDHDGTPLDTYRVLWEGLNGRGSWDANPHVWCISFKRVDGSQDAQ
jgi:hypothetical protein